MSYTFPVIPIGRDETDRRLENVVNRIQRHCKIVKVRPRPVAKDSEALKDEFHILSMPPLTDFQRRYLAG